MGFELLGRASRATAVLACIAAWVGASWVSFEFGLAIAAGALWSLAGFAALAGIVRLLKPGFVFANPLLAMTLITIKGPVLYGAGYLLLRAGLPPLGLVLGFQLLFLVITLQALGRFFTQGGRGPTARRAATTGTVALAFAFALAFAGAPDALANPTDPHAATPDSAHAASHGDDAHGAAAGAHADAGGHGEGGHSAHPELPNFITFLREFYAKRGQPTPAWLNFLHTWENIVFAILAAVLLIVVLGSAARPKALVPRGMQNFAEWLIGGLHDFFLGILGPQGKPYVPFVGSLFLYIATMNWFGMIPLLKSPNVSLNTTFALALVVFVYVQYIGITKHGLGGYLYHFAGQPKDAIGWGSAILLFPLELMGELIKPVSLSCRLFGNILGEDILLAVFVGLGVTVLAFMNSPVGLPLQLPFYFLSALFGVIQGLVFALLTTVYIVMMLPHDHGEHHEHHESPAGDHAVAHT
jgi:F-type H+-transporting ATPase subunit a